MADPDFSGLVFTAITNVVAIGSGRNSRVYKLTLADGTCVLGKSYYLSKVDSRDRLGVEFKAFSFLHEHGVSCVPRALAFDAQRQLAVYEYIGGGAVRDVCDSDLQDVVAFVRQLQRLSVEGETSEIGHASAACLTVLDICRIIDHRLLRLLDIETGEARPMQDYLHQELVVFFEILKNDLSSTAQKTSLTPILSPSDFGFHNCVRRESGQLVFVDFEYFGFDDPAKLIADFLLHPAMAISRKMQVDFLNGVLGLWDDRVTLHQRVQLYYPFIGLTWCLICLNEFLEDESGRRSFAYRSSASGQRLTQLARSKMMLSQIKEEYGNYPY